MPFTKAQDTMIETMDASKVSGTLPALDATNLTGLPPSGEMFLKSANDPEIDTNPATGVGTLWVNTTDGQMFTCMDATTDENIWKVVSGDETVESVETWTFQGTQYGYASGGSTPAIADSIERFSFVNDNTMGDVGSLIGPVTVATGHSSSNYAFMTGGWTGSAQIATIQKYSWDSQTDAVDTGKNLGAGANTAAAGFGNETHGYVAGGHKGSPNENWDIIQKFAYESTGTAVNIGNVAFPTGLYQNAGWSEATHGYIVGGYNYGGNFDNQTDVEKMAFASEGNSVKCGDLAQVVSYTTGSNSTTHGYIQGGFSTGWSVTANIQKFSFASEGTATAPSVLMTGQTVYTGGGTSSTTHGYTAGGNVGGAYIATVQKHSFTTDTDSTQCGALNVATGYCTSNMQI